MTDSLYIGDISFLLHAYAGTVKSLGKLNLHDINVHSENFFRDFLGVLRGIKLVNANDIWHDEPGIDLVNSDNKTVIQVSSDCTKKKIQDSLDKTDKTKYRGFHFYFLALTSSAKNLRNKTYTVPREFTFEASTDIFDIDSLIAEINSKRIEQKKALYELVKAHLYHCIEPQKNAASLSKVVEALDRASNSSAEPLQILPFVIPIKIELNHLEAVSGTINDHVIYSAILNNVYSTGEQFGKTTRAKIHSMLRRCYEDNKNKMAPENLYRHIADTALSRVLNSSNCPTDMMLEDIEWAISVIVADAFEDCKIFEHPKNLM